MFENITGWFRNNHLFLIIQAICLIILFWPFFRFGKIPLPGDILIGFYYPWKDQVWDGRAAGFPIKNFELSDAVTQFYPFKKEIVSQFQAGQIPLWNPYILSGTPLLADGHSGALYPLNILLFLPNFNFGWSLFILAQPLLAALFMFLYLRSLKLLQMSSILGALSFGFSVYFVGQMEFGTVFHTALWIPLSLLAVHRMLSSPRSALALLAFSLTMSFFAGFVQMFLYHVLLVGAYFLVVVGWKKRHIFWGVGTALLFALLSAAQLLPWLEFLPQTVRWQGGGLLEKPVEYLMAPKLLFSQIAPDFFGSPVTGNWIGSQFHYYEYIFYVGCLTLPLFLIAWKSHLKERFFFLIVTILSIFLTLDIAPIRALYQFNIPILNSLTPPRILGIATLSLSVLVALGFEEIAMRPKRYIIWAFLTPLAVIFFLVFYSNFTLTDPARYTAFRNLILPLAYSLLSLLVVGSFFKTKKIVFLLALMSIGVASLIYQDVKFTPFISQNLIFPNLKVISYLQDHLAPGEQIINTSSENFPVNTNMIYHLKTPNGYHPIQSSQYNQIASQLQFGNNSENFGRTIFLTNISKNLLLQTNVRYIITLENLNNDFLTPVYSEGQTRIYRIDLPLSSNKLEDSRLKNEFSDNPTSFIVGAILTTAGIIIWFIILML